MTYYLFNHEYTKLPDWTKVYASKIISFGGKKIKVNIGLNSQQIENEKSFTYILAENLPIKLMSQAKEFELESELEIVTDKYQITTLPFDITIIDEFLKTPNCLFYCFEEDDWNIVRWTAEEKNMVFESLLSYKTDNIILKTKLILPISI